MTAATLPDNAVRDFEVIGLVGFVHGVSHFFHLLLPALFPWLMRDFGLGFTEVGMTVTAFFVVSGSGQAFAGFLVDRFGATRMLAVGMGCFAVAALTLASAQHYSALIVGGLVAGFGNCVFHPADYTVLNRRVNSNRLGHAFSAHGLSGNLGWASAPLFITAVSTAAGWRWAATAAAGIALVALAILLMLRSRLDAPAASKSPNTRSASSLFGFLRSRAVWKCFLFFLLISIGFGVMQSYSVPALHHLYGITLGTAASALSAFMLGGAGGIFTGGFFVRHAASERIVAGALSLAALLALVLAWGHLPGWSVLPLMAAFGFCTGLAGPSRDLMVRQAATSRFGEAAYGRVYGFVYSGLDAGISLAPLIFGGYMDSARFGTVLAGVALVQTLAILTALGLGPRPEASGGAS